MLILNFSHPLTPDHVGQIEVLSGQAVERIVEIGSQIDSQQPLVEQVVTRVEQVGFSMNEWQTTPFLLNPPALNYISLALVAELHGRCGYFPAMIRLRPVPASVPPRYEVAEIINLQTVRDRARATRTTP
jgi:hypothetical protein